MGWSEVITGGITFVAGGGIGTCVGYVVAPKSERMKNVLEQERIAVEQQKADIQRRQAELDQTLQTRTRKADVTRECARALKQALRFISVDWHSPESKDSVENLHQEARRIYDDLSDRQADSYSVVSANVEEAFDRAVGEFYEMLMDMESNNSFEALTSGIFADHINCVDGEVQTALIECHKFLEELEL